MKVVPLFAQVSLGIDELQKNDFKELKGRSIALITNQTGVNRDGDSTIDILLKAPQVKLKCVMTPEHGFRGQAEHGQSVMDWIDPKTKLPIYSLYGTNNRPTEKMLKGVNTVVFDIQDIGTRFYTYITTMAMAMEEAAKKKLRFVVLDRPNPIRGDIVEGDLLDADIKRMTGYFRIPTRHGLTVGEIATWFNQTEKIHSDLHVIPMKGWKRNQWFDQNGISFIPPSPNIRNVNQALLYAGIGCFEATNVAVGRGTDTPFEIFGAPWIDSKQLCTVLREANFPGVLFDEIEFIPKNDIYSNQTCYGVKIILTDREKASPFKIFVVAFLFLAEKYPQQFKPVWEEVRVVTGSNKLKEAFEKKIPYEILIEAYDATVSHFQEQIAAFYLY